MSTGVPSDRLPNDALVMVGRCPDDDDDAAAVSPNMPSVATASRMASAMRSALPRIPVLAAVVYMDPPYLCGDPWSMRSGWLGDLLLVGGQARSAGVRGQGGAPAAQRGRTTLTPARRSQDWDNEDRVPGQRIVTTSGPAAGGGAMAGVRGRPALSWSAGRWPGDVMIDGVSHRVRPLVLSGPASVAWRQEHCGSWPRRISGVGRARTSRIGQATRPRSGVSDGGA